jgi:hypothetical protein
MRRIRIAAATVMVAAGLVGAVAAPASADPPLYDYLHRCVAPGFNVSSQDSDATSKEAHQARNDVRRFCREVDGTFTSTIERV